MNILLLAAILVFLQAGKEDDGQNIAICCMVESAFAITIFIFAYHACMVCLGTKAAKTLNLQLKKTKNRCLQINNEVIPKVKNSPPTATVVDLKTLLLEESSNSDNKKQ